jgi:hypothetical protein
MGVVSALDDAFRGLRAPIAKGSPSIGTAWTTNFSDRDVEKVSSLMVPDRALERPGAERRPLFEMAFGVIPSFNIGSQLGLEGWGAFAADAVLDPFNAVPLFKVGALNKVGRGGKLLRAFGRGGSRWEQGLAALADKQDDLVRTLENVKTAYTRGSQLETNSLQNAIKLLDDAGGNIGAASDRFKALAREAAATNPRVQRTADFSSEGLGFANPFGSNLPDVRTLRATQASLRKGGIEEARKFLQGEIIRKESLRRKMGDFVRAGGAGDVREMKKVAKAILKEEPSLRLKKLLGKDNMENIEDFIRVRRQGRAIGNPLHRGDYDEVVVKVRDPADPTKFIEETRLRRNLESAAQKQARNQLDGMKDPQRVLLQVRVPFSSQKYTLIGSAPGVEALGALAQRTKFVRDLALSGRGLADGAQKAARTLERKLNRPQRLAGADTMGDVMSVANKRVIGDDVPEQARSIQPIWRTFLNDMTSGRFFASLVGREFNDWSNYLADGTKVEKNQRHLRRKNVMNIIQDPQKYLKMSAKEAKVIKEGAKRTRPFGAANNLNTAGISEGTLQRHIADFELTDFAKAEGVDEDTLMMAETVQNELRELGEKALRDDLLPNLVGDGINSGYFPRITQVVKGKEDEYAKAVNGFREKASGVDKTFNPHAITRKVPFYDDLLELEKKGIVKVEKDPAKVLDAYYEGMTRSSAHRRLADRLRDTSVPVVHTMADEASRAAAAGQDVLARERAAKTGVTLGKLESDETFIPAVVRSGSEAHKAFQREYVKVTNPGVTSLAKHMGIPLKVNEPLLVHKDAARLLEIALGTDEAGKTMGTWMKLNQMAKRSLLSFSAFHMMALTESGIAALGVDFFRHLARFVRDPGGTTKRDFIEGLEVIEEGMKHGLHIGPVTDAEIGSINKFLRLEERKIPGISPAARAIGKLTGVWDRHMWDYYHNGLKAHAYQVLYERGLAKHGSSQATNVARGVAEHVNNAFGGQSFEQMLFSKRGQRYLRSFLLAPDWTLSNMRIATDVFANRFKKQEWFQRTGQWAGFPIGPADVATADVRAAFARRYALNAGLIWYGMVNLANIAFTGRPAWENPAGHKMDVVLPYQDEGGRQLFVRPGKQFREPWEFVESLFSGDPTKFFRRKASQLLGNGVAQFMGRDTFTGQPIVANDAGPLSATLQRIGYSAQNILPIGLQQATGFSRFGGPPSPGRALAGVAGLPIRSDFDRNLPLSQAPSDIPQEFADLFDDAAFRSDLGSTADQVQEAIAGGNLTRLPGNSLLPVSQ